MTERPVPPIYYVPADSARLGVVGRLVAAGIAGVCLAVLVTAATLTPAADGVGTHTALGMQPCGMLQNFGLPCITCGMTTSFAHTVRGQLLSAFWVQPMGALLALAAMLSIWAAGYAAVSGNPLHRLLLRVPVRYAVILPAAIAILAWVWKIILVRGGWDGT